MGEQYSPPGQTTQELLTEGEVSGGTLYFAIDDNDTEAPEFDGLSEADKKELKAEIESAEEFYNSIKDNSDYTFIASTLNDAISNAKKTADDKTEY